MNSTLFFHFLKRRIVGSSKRLVTSLPKCLTYREHYDKVSHQVGGSRVLMRLSNVGSEGTNAVLLYTWDDVLSDNDSDILDTRARAYITCAIYDVLRWMGRSCHPGPLYGQRPSWLIRPNKIPICLVYGACMTSEKVCRYHIGPVITFLDPEEASRMVDVYYPTTLDLATGFRECFAQITV